MNGNRELPYADLLAGRDPLEVLRETPRRISDLLRTLTPEQVENKPAPGKWSIREVICHLADCEIAWAWRLRVIFAAENAALQPFDQNAWARAYNGDGYTTSAASAAWTALRQWNVALIGTVGESDRDRTGKHPEMGDLTFWNVVEIAAGHDLHHLRGLEERAVALAPPGA